MIYLIQTIGQRDVQLHFEDNECNYASFKKDSLKEVQNLLKQQLSTNDILWKPISGKEGKQSLNEDSLTKSAGVLCFPLTEAMIMNLDENEEYTLYILTTDRSHIDSESLTDRESAFIQKEPYLFAPLIKNRIEDIQNHYEKYLTRVVIVNLCAEMTPKNIDITDSFAFKQIDNFFQKEILVNDDVSGIEIYSSGGMPSITNALDSICNAYFPKETQIMEQAHGQLYQSEKNKIQRKYSLKFALLQRLRNYDFQGALKDALDLNMKSLDKSSYQLLEICNTWLYSDKYEALNEITNYTKHDSSLSETLGNMSEMLEDKNTIPANVIRILQEARAGNWWSVATLLITIGEIFIINKILETHPKTETHVDNWLKFNSEELGFDLQFDERDRRKIFDRDYPRLLNKNWMTYEVITESGIESKFSEVYISLDSFRVNLDKIRKARNAFIHEGKSINRQKLSNALELPLTNKHLDITKSNQINYLIQELTTSPNYTFINWLPILREELIERVTKLSPLPSQ